MSKENSISPVTLSLETIFELMSERRRRYTLYALIQTDETGIYLDDLAAQLSRLETTDGQSHPKPAETYLRENCIPTLADVNIIDYDPRTEAIHYWPNPSLEEWVKHATFKENKTDW